MIKAEPSRNEDTLDSIISSQVFKKQKMQLGRLNNAFMPFEQERDGMGRLNNKKLNESNQNYKSLNNLTPSKRNLHDRSAQKICSNIKDLNTVGNEYINQSMNFSDTKKAKIMKRFSSKYLKDTTYEHLQNIDWAYAMATKVRITDMCPEFADRQEEMDVEDQKNIYNKMLCVKKKRPTIAYKNVKPVLNETVRKDFDTRDVDLDWNGFVYFNGETDFQIQNKQHAAMSRESMPMLRHPSNYERKRHENMNLEPYRMMTDLRENNDLVVRQRSSIAQILPEHRNSKKHLESSKSLIYQSDDAPSYDNILLRPESNAYSIPDTIVHSNPNGEPYDHTGVVSANVMSEPNYRSQSGNRDILDSINENDKEGTFFIPT